jgi:SLOG-like protein
MTAKLLEEEAAALSARFPIGPRLVVIGSTSFWHAESEATCTAIGYNLSTLDRLVLVTGGVEGVGEALGRSFWASCGGASDRCVIHILPRGYRKWDYGETLFAGSDMWERREILGRLADVYLAIEGGPGTEHEASVVLKRSAIVIPVGRSGGHSADLYARVPRPSFVGERMWQALADTSLSVTGVAEAVTGLVRICLAQGPRDRDSSQGTGSR